MLCCALVLSAGIAVHAQDGPAPSGDPGATAGQVLRPVPQQDAAAIAEAEDRIFQLVNIDRVRLGLKPLKRNPNLDKTATAHSVLLAEHQDLSHKFAGEPELVDRMVATGMRFVNAGENVVSAQDAVSAHDALMGSSEHRANIMNPAFNSIGLGIIESDKQLWVTEDFAKVMPKVSDGSAETELVQEYNQLRAAAGMPPLEEIPLPKLHQDACEMAQRDKLDASRIHVDGAKYVVAFATLDLHKLPAGAQKLATQKMRGISVGVCFTTSATYTFPMYWVIVASYF